MPFWTCATWGRFILLRGLPKHAVTGMVWYGMVEVCEGAPVAVSSWVLTDRHDLGPCAANSLHRVTISVSNIIGGTGTWYGMVWYGMVWYGTLGTAHFLF